MPIEVISRAIYTTSPTPVLCVWSND